LYEAAVSTQKALVDAYPTNPEFQSELAGKLHNLAELLESQGLMAEALAKFQEARTISERAVASDPTVARYRMFLANHLSGTGTLLANSGKHTEALELARAALKIREDLLDSDPADTRLQMQLAWDHISIGDRLRDTRRPSEALKHIEKGQAIYQKLVEKSPTFIGAQGGLAFSHDCLSLLLHTTGRSAQARAESEAALAIWSNLARDNPTVTGHQFYVAQVYAGLGSLVTNSGDPQAGEGILTRGIEVDEVWVQKHPRDWLILGQLGGLLGARGACRYMQGRIQPALGDLGRAIDLLRTQVDPAKDTLHTDDLISALGNRAEILIRQGQYRNGLADFEEVLALLGAKADEWIAPPVFRLFVALTKARLGDGSDLARLGDTARETVRDRAGVGNSWKGYWILFYDAACVHAALGSAALETPGPPLAERQQMAERNFNRAFELLQKSCEAKDPISVAEFQRDRTLDPLRSHPRFQLIMMDAGFPDKAFGP
jgi:tetratricopeptide (TPR) repeat protein